MSLSIPKHKKQPAAYYHAPKQERAAAARLGGKTTLASGSLSEKGDVRLNRYARLECKATAKKSFSFTREMGDKIEQAAMQAGELPAIEVEFLPIIEEEYSHPGGKWVIVPVWVLDQILQTLQK